MASIDDRKKGFENKFAHDEGIKFKVEARTSKLLGLWAAEKMGLEGREAESYASECVKANLELSGYEDLLGKIQNDLDTQNADITKTALAVKLECLMTEAMEQVKTEIEDDQ